ncbi:polyphosphate kinase 1 [Mucilaginibacter limnophilus]|uniref:Polyphosphate kinase n=1 Tax=Mucilaginibacter limnophilus TaxID=1932778 RepID=A0A437MYM9_9SPHI|nr:polyphosphate kinase 1 [Mucilaginibacter limnophilus]RVU02753.1 polyphosphate kinase 1 [Mucilaginibacter limnophilus]
MATTKHYFNNRDLSWLSFNGRVLAEAESEAVPLLERIKFLSIFSSNLDEFYRVRMPVIAALENIGEEAYILQKAKGTILSQQRRYGRVLTSEIIPQLRKNNVHVYYNEEIPEKIESVLTEYFYSDILAYLQPVYLDGLTRFFPENNLLYFIVQLQEKTGSQKSVIVNIPSDKISRFFTTDVDNEKVVVFIDDIIRLNLQNLFLDNTVEGCYSFKVTRDAELDLKDEYPGDVAEEVEKQLNKRDQGLATRFLHAPDIPLRNLQFLITQLGLNNAVSVEGGRYHNLKDLVDFPVTIPQLRDVKWHAIQWPVLPDKQTLLEHIDKQDVLLNVPYQSYKGIQRFFNEAATNPDVEEIYITLYRVAKESKIVNALISAAKNGKKITVMIELKARFDEANNIKWARKMKAAGVKIIYSITALKVHAKVALVKRKCGDRLKYTGLLATGNFNESTAAFYTDHILMTANPTLTREMELLLMFLTKRKKPLSPDLIPFKELLVSQFNLQQRFIELIDREIDHAKNGMPASITIKMNNLEEQVLISKLYEASEAGVGIKLIIRGICCIVPGVEGMSSRITVRRIVDRYLEHGRVFIFGNKGKTEVYMGSSDWMNRNIYRRIEVCFPVYDEQIKNQILDIIALQLQDNVKAVIVDEHMQNQPVTVTEPFIQSQFAIYNQLKTSVNELSI